MLLLLLAFLGGILTIISPCILPVLPFVFARPGQSFLRGTLPLLAGMGLTFAAVAVLAAVGGAWAVRVNSYGRLLALLLLAAFGVALLSTRVAEWLARPVVALGNRLAGTGERPGSILPAITLGIATGLLWAPCAGPILGLILTGAAISGPSARTTLLLLAYALGAMTSLALAMLAGRRIAGAFRSSLGAAEWLRRGLGVAVLAGVVAIAAGWDTGVLTRLSLASTNQLEQSLVDTLRPRPDAAGGTMTATVSRVGSGNGAPAAAPVEGELPALSGAVEWLNSAPLTKQELRGRVVVIDFWTYSCINCLRSLPYLRAWDERYRDHGLTVIGVHAPEFAFEKDEANVRRAVKDLGIHYPVAIDNNYALWRAFDNQYWPAHYFIDAQGRIRGHHFGEGDYDDSEQLIRALLNEAGYRDLPAAMGTPGGAGIEVAADEPDIASPETYIGYERATNFASAVEARDRPASYAVPRTLKLNEWSLGGTWTVGSEFALSRSPGDTIVFRFHARDLHLVLGPDAAHQPVRFRVMIDGREPGADHGSDTDEHGNGTVHEQRLYQLIRQSGTIGDRTFSIEFLDAGVRAYAFTFG